MVLEVTTDKTYDGPELKRDGEKILLSKANVFILAPFANIDNSRTGRKEWMMHRLYAAPFVPGDPVIFDGQFGPRGHGTSFHPFFDPEIHGKDRELQDLKLEVKHKHRGAYVVDEKETQKLLTRLDTYKQLLRKAQGSRMPTVRSPVFWATAPDVDLLNLEVDTVALMTYAYRYAVMIDEGRKKFQAILDDDRASEADKGKATEQMARYTPIVLPDDEGWDEMLHTSTEEGWNQFWRAYCLAPGAGDFSDVDGMARHLLTQIAYPDNGLVWVPLHVLESTNYVENVYVEKMLPRAYRLDRPLRTYNRLSRERSLKDMVQIAEAKWNARVNGTAKDLRRRAIRDASVRISDGVVAGLASELADQAAITATPGSVDPEWNFEAAAAMAVRNSGRDFDHEAANAEEVQSRNFRDEATQQVERATGKTIGHKQLAARHAKLHASALIYETPVLRQQLWVTWTWARKNAILRKKAGLDNLKKKHGDARPVQGIVNAGPPISVGGPHRGGLDA